MEPCITEENYLRELCERTIQLIREKLTLTSVPRIVDVTCDYDGECDNESEAGSLTTGFLVQIRIFVLFVSNSLHIYNINSLTTGWA